MKPAQIVEMSATADVTVVSSHLRAVTLTGGSDAATLVVRAGGATGTTVLTVKAAAGVTVPVSGLDDALCADGIHATLTGTGPVATFVYV